MALAFNSWRYAASEMRQEGDNLVLAVTRWQQSYLSSAFNAWLAWVEDRRDRYANLHKLLQSRHGLAWHARMGMSQLTVLP